MVQALYQSWASRTIASDDVLAIHKRTLVQLGSFAAPLADSRQTLPYRRMPLDFGVEN